MSIESEIRRTAAEIADRLQRQATQFRREQLEAEKLAANLKAKGDTASRAPERLANFSVQLGTDYQCPSCWIEREARGALTPIPGNDREDFLKCQKCGHVFPIPIR